jgi:hypothetical protein
LTRYVYGWHALNFLKLNDNKTELLVLSSKHQDEPTLDSVNIGNDKIASTKQARNIGVVFDSKMTLTTHVNSMTSKAFWQIRNLSQIRKYLDKEASEVFVHAFITSRLDYCNSLLYGLPNVLVKKLQHVQNTAARVVTLTRRREHITPVLKYLHWLPVHQRIKFKILLITFKALNNQAPGYIAELIHLHQPGRNLRSCDKLLLHKPVARSVSYGERAFSIAAPTLWNTLPLQVRQSPSISTFKTRLKSHLFTQ